MKLKFGFYSSLKKSNDRMPSFTYSITRHLVTHLLKKKRREIVFCPFLFCGVYIDIKPALFPFYTAGCSVNHAKCLLKKKKSSNQTSCIVFELLYESTVLTAYKERWYATASGTRPTSQHGFDIDQQTISYVFFFSIFILKIMDSETCCNFVK
jgi:hypothetical protein